MECVAAFICRPHWTESPDTRSTCFCIDTTRKVSIQICAAANSEKTGMHFLSHSRKMCVSKQEWRCKFRLNCYEMRKNEVKWSSLTVMRLTQPSGVGTICLDSPDPQDFRSSIPALFFLFTHSLLWSPLPHWSYSTRNILSKRKAFNLYRCIHFLVTLVTWNLWSELKGPLRILTWEIILRIFKTARALNLHFDWWHHNQSTHMNVHWDLFCKKINRIVSS